MTWVELKKVYHLFTSGTFQANSSDLCRNSLYLYIIFYQHFIRFYSARVLQFDSIQFIQFESIHLRHCESSAKPFANASKASAMPQSHHKCAWLCERLCLRLAISQVNRIESNELNRIESNDLNWIEYVVSLTCERNIPGKQFRPL